MTRALLASRSTRNWASSFSVANSRASETFGEFRYLTSFAASLVRQHLPETGEVVGPEQRLDIVGPWRVDADHFRVVQERLVLRDQNPCWAVGAGFRIPIVVHSNHSPLQVLRDGARHGVEVEKTIGNVNRQDAVVLKMTTVYVRALLRQQMHGNRVTGERVHDNHVELVRAGLRELAIHHYPRITDGYLRLGRRVAQVGEDLAVGQIDHGRIDFVEAVVVALARRGSHAAGAQADHGHMEGSFRDGIGVAPRVAPHGQEHTRPWTVIGGRRHPPIIIFVLQPMLDLAMSQWQMFTDVVRVFAHLQDAIEVSRNMDDLVANVVGRFHKQETKEHANGHGTGPEPYPVFGVLRWVFSQMAHATERPDASE